MRIGVNSGEAIVREVGGDGHVAYPLVGDTVNTGRAAREPRAGRRGPDRSQTYEQLPDGTVVEERTGLRIKGKDDVINAYVLLALP